MPEQSNAATTSTVPERREFPCVRCQATVLWMHTEKGKPILVDAASCADHTVRYDRDLNHCHYETCTNKPEGQSDSGNNRAPCRDCGDEVVWMTTSKGKKVPVNPDTYHDEAEFSSWANQVHWETCPIAIERKKVEQEAQEAQKLHSAPPKQSELADILDKDEIPL